MFQSWGVPAGSLGGLSKLHRGGLDSHVTIAWHHRDVELQGAALVAALIIAVWLNSEACYVLWFFPHHWFLACWSFAGLSLVKWHLGSASPPYKMWLKHLTESSALGTTNSVQQMLGNAFNKKCRTKINCNFLCLLCYLWVLFSYHEGFVLFAYELCKIWFSMIIYLFSLF
jgi:hypothetical protein